MQEKARDDSGANVFIHNALDRGARQGGCMICRAIRREEERLVHSFLYEGMMTSSARQEFLERGGFCYQHFRMALRLTRQAHMGQSALAILCSQLVPQAQREIEGKRKPHSSSFGRRLKSKAEAQEACLFCQDRKRIEQDLTGGLEHLLDDRFLADSLLENGLCYPHSRLAMRHWKQAGKRQWLADNLRRYTDTLALDLKELLKKYEHEHHDEPIGQEIDVVDRSMAFLVGYEE